MRCSRFCSRFHLLVTVVTSPPASSNLQDRWPLGWLRCIQLDAILRQYRGELRLALEDHLIEALLQRLVAMADAHRHREDILFRSAQGPGYSAPRRLKIGIAGAESGRSPAPT